MKRIPCHANFNSWLCDCKFESDRRAMLRYSGLGQTDFTDPSLSLHNEGSGPWTLPLYKTCILCQYGIWNVTAVYLRRQYFSKIMLLLGLIKMVNKYTVWNDVWLDTTKYKLLDDNVFTVGISKRCRNVRAAKKPSVLSGPGLPPTTLLSDRHWLSIADLFHWAKMNTVYTMFSARKKNAWTWT